MKIVGIAQRGTESGLTRIRDLVASDEIEFLYLKDFKKADEIIPTIKICVFNIYFVYLFILKFVKKNNNNKLYK